jgi:hypothetical protein
MSPRSNGLQGRQLLEKARMPLVRAIPSFPGRAPGLVLCVLPDRLRRLAFIEGVSEVQRTGY